MCIMVDIWLECKIELYVEIWWFNQLGNDVLGFFFQVFYHIFDKLK